MFIIAIYYTSSKVEASVSTSNYNKVLSVATFRRSRNSRTRLRLGTCSLFSSQRTATLLGCIEFGLSRTRKGLRHSNPEAIPPDCVQGFGGYCGGVTPVPIPNTEVKPSCADGTWLETTWESRTPPDFFRARGLTMSGPLSRFDGLGRRPRGSHQSRR